MKIYVESNFVLELALQQEQASSCEEILELCEGVDRELVGPAYSLPEPYETLIRRRKERERIQRDLYVELQQLARSATYSGRLDAFDAVSTLLIGTAEQDAARLEEVRSQIAASCCRALMRDSATFVAIRAERCSRERRCRRRGEASRSYAFRLVQRRHHRWKMGDEVAGESKGL